MQIHNYMEDVVEDVLGEMIRNQKDLEEFCQNQGNRMDIIAATLNKLMPKYIVTPRGRVYTKLQELAAQFKADVIREVSKAIELVKSNPRH